MSLRSCRGRVGLLALVAILPHAAQAQLPGDSATTVVHAAPLVAAWGSLGLGAEDKHDGGIGGTWGAHLSVGPVLLTYRSSDFGPFIAAGNGVRDHAFLAGVRSPGRRFFASATGGYANVTPYHQCDDCGYTVVDHNVGAFAYDVRLHANYIVPGIAVSYSGTLGAPRVRYSAFTAGIELGWFGR